MKCGSALIIGGAKGLGSALCDVFGEISDCPRIVRSISRGDWTLSSPQTLQPFLNPQPDLIIVCAHLGYQIGDVLKFLVESTDGRVDFIVIGSMVSETQRDHYYRYQLEKLNLDHVVRQLQLSNRERSIMLVKPGLIDTESVRLKSGKKMDPRVVAKIILSTYFNSKQSNTSVISLGFTAR